MKKSLLVAIGIVSLLGISACSSDSSSLSVKESNSAGTSATAEETAPSVSAAGSDSGTDETAADGSDASISGVPGIAGECSTYLSAFAGAISGQDADLGNLSGLFDSLDGKVPDDLQSAVEVLAKDFGELQAIYAKYDNDFSKAATDPGFIALFSNSEFTEASAKFNGWITAGCPTE